MLKYIAKLYVILGIVFLSTLTASSHPHKGHHHIKLAKHTKKQKVLVLYDNAGPYGDTGKTHAILLKNLLGHFNVKIRIEPVTKYRSKHMKNQKAVFYLGTTFNPLNYYAEGSTEKNAYLRFFKDVATRNKNIIWINYNLNLLKSAWDANQWGNTTMGEKFGFTFQYTNPAIKYNRVKYKDTELYKGVIPFATPGADVSLCLDEGDNRYACALELNRVNILDNNKTKVYAEAYSTLLPNRAPDPYIIKGNHFWFVGDIPFTYMSEEDRYLAFSDLLHDMLGIYHKESHKAIMRLEDVDARTDIYDLLHIANLAREKKVRFSVAAISQYEDPFGIENDGIPTTIKISDSIVGEILSDLYSEGLIDVVAHGFTHQYGNIQNPYNGLSGDDFEFMRVVENSNLSYSYLSPTMNDSGFYAYMRMYKAKSILKQLGIKAFAWEAPHYMAGPNQYRAIRELFPVQYARVLYYPNENSNDMTKKYKFVGQFFPYIIKHDMYGSTIIPENIHNIEDAPNAGYRKLTPADTIRFAKKLKVVRDGIASFYYHPYLGTDDLEMIIDGLRNAGYDFVSAPSLLKKRNNKR